MSVFTAEISEIPEERMVESPRGPDFDTITPEQVCQNLTLLWELARFKEAKLNYIKPKLAIQERTPIFEKEKVDNFLRDRARLEMELQTQYGEIALISCPILTCKNHYPHGNSTNINSNLKDNRKNSKNNDKTKQIKRAGQEKFKLPKKAARTMKDIPLEQVICTTKNKFAVLKVEQDSREEISDPPPIQAKPIMCSG
ncbi:hypothetical protein TNIN_6941 [Trichonephila inaurata madagascariensis]|uniref:Uncharacterized protein n=1 Tax=Trichonephila inaurata madagascariensis TaxID=2747483 RepID=A0A8X6WY60_9ARAC|nr:hypothetical protein TNIN_6941 [Trichonephila inaurata madagascariensis]